MKTKYFVVQLDVEALNLRYHYDPSTGMLSCVLTYASLSAWNYHVAGKVGEL